MRRNTENQSAYPAGHCLTWIHSDNISKKLNAAPVLEAVCGLRQMGWRVDFLVGGVDGKQKFHGVEFMGIPHPNLPFVKQIIYHLKVLKFVFDDWNTTDFVVFRSISVPWMLLLKLNKILHRDCGPLLVLDTRTLPMDFWSLKERLRGKYNLFLSALAIRFVDGQTTNTRRMAEAYHIPKEQFWGNWPSAVDLDIFSPAVESRVWPQGDEPVQIVYVGALTPERDILPFCQAVEKANQEGECFELTLVGGGKERENLEEFAAHTGGRICVLGVLPHEQIPSVLAKTHIGVLPFPDTKEYRVSSPIKLFEYMGAGMPVIATRIVCHTEVIGDQPIVFWAENSTVDSFVATLHHVWNDRATFAKRGSLAAELAQEHTWAASVKCFAAALEWGLAKHGGKSL